MTLKHDAWLQPCRGLVALLAMTCLALAGCSKKSPKELLETASTMMQSRDTFGAEMQYQKILDQYPKSPEALTARAGLLTCYRMTNDYDNAFAQFDLLIQEVGGLASPRGFNGLLNKLTLYAQIKQFDKGLACALEAEKSLGQKLPLEQRLELESYIGQFYVVTKQKPKAQDLAKRMIEEVAGQPMFHNYAFAMTATAYDQPSDRAALAGIYQDFLKRFPTSPVAPDVRFAISQIFDSMGKKAEAKVAYDQALAGVKATLDKALGSDKIVLTMKLGEMLQVHGDKAGFRATLGGLIEHYPTTQQAAQALLALADQDCQDGKFQDALAKLGRVINGPMHQEQQTIAVRMTQAIRQSMASGTTRRASPPASHQALTSGAARQAVLSTSGTLRSASPSAATTLATPTEAKAAQTAKTTKATKQVPASAAGAAAR
jgi:TolA-binding protein